MPSLLELIKDKKPEKPIKEPKKAEKVDFNRIPEQVIQYTFDEFHSPTIIKLMNAYEDIAGKSAPRSKGFGKEGQLKAIVYVSLQKLHQLQKGEIK